MDLTGRRGRAKVGLQILPQDVLLELSPLISGHDLARLWLCGCKTLQAKLGISGVVRKFEVSLENQETFVWPTLVCVFAHLTHFSLVSSTFDPPTHLDARHLMLLPATLVSLKLRFHDSLPFFWNALSLAYSSDSESIALKNLKTLHISDSYASELRTPKQRLCWPPALLSLTLQLHSQRDLLLDVSTLPLSLTHLHCGVCILKTCEIPFPNSLTSLEIGLMSIPPQLFNMLPHGLKKLAFSSSTWAVEDASDCSWKTLPPNLESLSCHVFGFMPEHCSQLPRSLTYLVGTHPQYTTSSGEYVDVLPPRLKHVEQLIPSSINKSIASRLPNTLELWHSSHFTQWTNRVVNLELPIVKVDEDALPHLPPNISSLLLSCSFPPLVNPSMPESSPSHGGAVSCLLSEELRHLQLPRIPGNFKNMSITNCSGLESLNLLPETLQILIIKRGPLPRPGGEYFSDLPTFKLTVLDIRALENKDAIPPEKWNFLPRTLLALRISLPPVLASHTSQLLPRQLTSLKMQPSTSSQAENGRCAMNVDWLRNLPDWLSTLSFGPITSVVSSQNEAISPKDERERIQMQFPQRLTHLRFFAAPHTSWLIPSVVKSLPKALNTCQLYLQAQSKGTCVTITDEDVVHTPLDLRKITLPPYTTIPDKWKKWMAHAIRYSDSPL